MSTQPDNLEATARELLARQLDCADGRISVKEFSDAAGLMCDCIAALLEDRAALQARCEAAERDARRYRQLRNSRYDFPSVYLSAGSDDWGWCSSYGSDVDEAVDAAIAKGAAHE